MANVRGSKGPSQSLSIIRQRHPDVKKIINATKPVIVKVLATDGKNGQRKHDSCAMAEACKREMDLDGAIMGRATAYLVKGTSATRYQVAGAVREEIIAFDRSGIFSPGSYKLYPAQQSRAWYAKDKSRAKTGRNVKARKEITGLRQVLSAA